MCPTDYVFDSTNYICYLFPNWKTTAVGAESYCQSRSQYYPPFPPSTVPVFANMSEFNSFQTIAWEIFKRNRLIFACNDNFSRSYTQGYVHLWLGGSRPCSSDVSRSSFLWIDNTSIAFTDPWDPAQPDNWDFSSLPNLQETCMCLDTTNNFSWIDCHCAWSYNFACQYRIDKRKVIVAYVLNRHEKNFCSFSYASCQFFNRSLLSKSNRYIRLLYNFTSVFIEFYFFLNVYFKM